MDVPHVIVDDNIQSAYIKAVEFLSVNHWEYYNLIVQINNADSFNNIDAVHLTDFAKLIEIKTPKIVASTIFPDGMYRLVKSRQDLYYKYNKRLYPKAKYGRWGTYFNRMISYYQNGDTINQLENIISKINARKTDCKAAYTIYIQYPGSETTLKMGAPCLNYLAVQIECQKLGILAVYRNHDFLEKAYGNYVGLCNLIKFISLETKFEIGSLTCVSSHAYVARKRNELLKACRKLYNGLA